MSKRLEVFAEWNWTSLMFGVGYVNDKYIEEKMFVVSFGMLSFGFTWH